MLFSVNKFLLRSQEKIDRYPSLYGKIIKMILQDLPLEVLLEIAKLHPWTACELSKTVRNVGLYSLENDMKRWYKVEKHGETFILVKSSKESCKKRLLHSWDDIPAVPYINDCQCRYIENKQRGDDDLPPLIWSNNVQVWYKEGRVHRGSDLPAAIDSDGNQSWFKEDKRHRDGDKPAVIYSNGSESWWKEGKRHRDGDKPAFIGSDSTKVWYKDGKRHRDGDKPAAVYPDGDLEWHKEGEQFFPEEIAKNIRFA